MCLYVCLIACQLQYGMFRALNLLQMQSLKGLKKMYGLAVRQVFRLKVRYVTFNFFIVIFTQKCEKVNIDL